MLWEASERFGRHGNALGGFGRFCEGLEGFVRFFGRHGEALVGFWRLWEALTGFAWWLWEALA